MWRVFPSKKTIAPYPVKGPSTTQRNTEQARRNQGEGGGGGILVVGERKRDRHSRLSPLCPPHC